MLVQACLPHKHTIPTDSMYKNPMCLIPFVKSCQKFVFSWRRSHPWLVLFHLLLKGCFFKRVWGNLCELCMIKRCWCSVTLLAFLSAEVTGMCVLITSCSPVPLWPVIPTSQPADKHKVKNHPITAHLWILIYGSCIKDGRLQSCRCDLMIFKYRKVELFSSDF